ncbi:ATP/GTP-binding protein [Aeromicrobium alkaliterrae]|uniref:ATPase n=1 Tax=Aeromicrobium alkaliterrae TaxID=302168 RepID=A0ABN2K943_9ACTN
MKRRRSEQADFTPAQLAERERYEADQAMRAALAKRPSRVGARGWSGQGAGAASYISPPTDWRGSTVQVCGLWPFAAGSGVPTIGVPLGRYLGPNGHGSTVCCDPISWFERTSLILNPSMFVLGLPALGKSTLVRRMSLGLSGFGVLPMFFGDLKPDYVDLVEAMGGQVIRLGRGRGGLNVLDPGGAAHAAERLQGKAKIAVLADMKARRETMVGALLTIARRTPPTVHEENIVSAALRVLDEKHDGVPILGDLLEVIREAPEELRRVALDRGDIDRYRDATHDLEASLMALTGDDRLGTMFNAPTSVAMDLGRPVVFDVSAVDESDKDLQAATLMACWSTGFGAINVSHALADAGLEPQRRYFIVLDELWRALRSGPGMVDRVDALTRLNRQMGVGQAMISHTMSDLQALPNAEDRMKARGFVERAGFVVCGGLPEGEMKDLTTAVGMSQAEQQLLMSWSSPATWDTGGTSAPPARGKFLIKVGSRPGIPVQVQLTEAERAVNDTNKRWAQVDRPAAQVG